MIPLRRAKNKNKKIKKKIKERERERERAKHPQNGSLKGRVLYLKEKAKHESGITL